MFKFCETEKLKAAIGAAFLFLLLGVGTWGLLNDWRTYGRTYNRAELINATDNIDGLIMTDSHVVDNLRTLVLMWVFLGVPCAFLIDHIEFVQWVLYCWEPLPPNEIE